MFLFLCLWSNFPQNKSKENGKEDVEEYVVQAVVDKRVKVRDNVIPLSYCCRLVK